MRCQARQRRRARPRAHWTSDPRRRAASRPSLFRLAEQPRRPPSAASLSNDISQLTATCWQKNDHSSLGPASSEALGKAGLKQRACSASMPIWFQACQAFGLEDTRCAGSRFGKISADLTIMSISETKFNKDLFLILYSFCETTPPWAGYFHHPKIVQY